MSAVRGSMRAALAVAMVAAGAVAVGPRETLAAPAPAAAARRAPAPRLSMDQAVRLVEQRYHARVVRAETREQGNRTIYVLRLLDQAGRVFIVRMDAASGRIL
jgi:uncharacterized membrane protein YkoI